ncbi:MAG TPA: hypothetical protein ENJ55_04055 [Rhizobiales bacterium]|nr:hypothetical protein [Hyphomicrobiales bacterium]
MNQTTSQKKASWYKGLSVTRWIFAIFGILIMLFAGGCTLLFLGNFIQMGGQNGGYEMVFYIGQAVGVGLLLLGLLIWWLAAKAGRRNNKGIQ